MSDGVDSYSKSAPAQKIKHSRTNNKDFLSQTVVNIGCIDKAATWQPYLNLLRLSWVTQ